MSEYFTSEQWADLRRAEKEAALASLPGASNGAGQAPDLLPKAFLPYQADVVALLEDTGTSVLLVEKSRRIGLTWALAAYAVLRAARTRAAGGQDVHYISYAQAMTRDFIADCGDWARAFGHAAGAVEDYLWPDGQDETGADRFIQAFRISFASGFEINGLSSAPRSLRGKQGVVIIDEAGFVDNLKELMKAALALLMWGGQVIVCSTHNGSDNEFNILIQDTLAGRKPYQHRRIDFDQALRQGLYERICLRTGRHWTPEAEAGWRQEIMAFYGDGADEELFCIPSQGSGAWLTAPLIEARMTADGPILRLELPPDYLHLPELNQRQLMAPFWEELEEALPRLDKRKSHALGFDFARVADLSVLALLSIDRVLTRRLELTVEMRRVPGHEQKAVVRKVIEQSPRLVGAAFDAVGMGWTVAEDMGRIFGLRQSEDDRGLVWAIQLNEGWYRLNMPPLKAAFEDETIAISKDDDHLTDLRLVKVVRGTPRVPDIRTGETGKKRHGDFAISLGLAHFASRLQWFDYDYVPVSELERMGRPSLFEEPYGGRGGGIDPDFSEGLF